MYEITDMMSKKIDMVAQLEARARSNAL